MNGEERLLDLWAKDLNKLSGQLVKKNKKRSVWRVTSCNGRDYFVKREKKFRFPFTRSKAEREFNAFVLLEMKNLPCAEYAAWSSTLHDSIVVSCALPDSFCSLTQFWYTREEVDFLFLRQLCDFLEMTAQAGIHHPDFHAGNLMTDGENIVMIDPVGIVSAKPTNSPPPEMLIPLWLLFGEIPSETIAKSLHKSGLYASDEEALEFLLKMAEQQKELVEKEWEKRRRQILSGTSKFASEPIPGKFYRNNAWHMPILQYSEDLLVSEEFSREEGEALWLSSFRDQLLKRSPDRIPIIYEIMGEKVKISFLKEKKYSFFYGFR